MITTILTLHLILSALSSYPKGDIPVTKANTTLEEKGASILLDVPFIHQIDNLPDELKPIIKTTACGPSALAMVLNYYGNSYSLEEIISRLPESVYIKGDRYYDLMDGPKLFGYTSIKTGNSPKDIFETLSDGHPIILNIQNYDGITGHALVVTGVKEFDGEHAKSLIAHDPYRNSNREFEYINDNQLRQPEGYINYIGHNPPFYIIKHNLSLKNNGY